MQGEHGAVAGGFHAHLGRLRSPPGEKIQRLEQRVHGAVSVRGLRLSGHEQLRSVRLEDGATAVGRPLMALGLREASEHVTAVRWRGLRAGDPSGDLVLLAGDAIALRGLPGALERAEQRLLQQ